MEQARVDEEVREIAGEGDARGGEDTQIGREDTQIGAPLASPSPAHLRQGEDTQIGAEDTQIGRRGYTHRCRGYTDWCPAPRQGSSDCGPFWRPTARGRAEARCTDCEKLYVRHPFGPNPRGRTPSISFEGARPRGLGPEG